MEICPILRRKGFLPSCRDRFSLPPPEEHVSICVALLLLFCSALRVLAARSLSTARARKSRPALQQQTMDGIELQVAWDCKYHTRFRLVKKWGGDG